MAMLNNQSVISQLEISIRVVPIAMFAAHHLPSGKLTCQWKIHVCIPMHGPHPLTPASEGQ